MPMERYRLKDEEIISNEEYLAGGDSFEEVDQDAMQF